MSTTPGPAPLDGHHRRTLEAIFQHPVSHNIEWHAVLSLLRAAGSVEESHDGKFVVTVGARTVVIEPPRDKDIQTDLVVDLRHLLGDAGYGPGG